MTVSAPTRSGSISTKTTIGRVPEQLCARDPGPATVGGIRVTYDPFAPYDPTKVGAIVPYDPAKPDAWRGQVSGAPNGGRGFHADLAGNELPNSPRITANIGAQYTFFLGDWDLTCSLFRAGRAR